MKTIIVLTVILFLAVISFAQEEGTGERPSEIKSKRVSGDASGSGPENTKQEDIFGKDEDSPGGTKSFTLDAKDAVLEEKTFTEDETEIVKPDVAESTSYHYNGDRQKDEIQTLAGKNSHHGGFGGISFRASEFNNKDIIMAGFRAGWIINRALGIGFEGYGVIPTAEYEGIDPDVSLRSRAVGGYGGMFLEPIVLSNKVVHVTFPIAGGAGWLGYIVDWEQNQNYYSNDLIDDDVFWYLEPGAALELNVARNFRINTGVSYRFTKDLELISTSTSAFDAWNYFFTLKFGSF
ncbi:MAG: hypothetical protein MI975_21430 [Cytophagales bacterium]|nr:hypothetical protein [Cytophagales bacterium]